MSNTDAERCVMWEVFLFYSKIWLTTCQRSIAICDSGPVKVESFFVDHRQLKQAEPVTSPLCPERCIIIIVGWVDRCRPYYITLPFVFAVTFP